MNKYYIVYFRRGESRITTLFRDRHALDMRQLKLFAKKHHKTGSEWAAEVVEVLEAEMEFLDAKDSEFHDWMKSPPYESIQDKSR